MVVNLLDNDKPSLHEMVKHVDHEPINDGGMVDFQGVFIYIYYIYIFQLLRYYMTGTQNDSYFLDVFGSFFLAAASYGNTSCLLTLVVQMSPTCFDLFSMMHLVKL